MRGYEPLRNRAIGPIYLITDRHLVDDLTEAVEQALMGGVGAVQLREKDMETRPLLSLAEKMRGLTSEFGAMLFINDRLDIALSVGADGVHLGGRSIPVSAVRAVVKDALSIGASAHSLKEAKRAEEEGADFITLGPVYETPSKQKYGLPVGLETLRAVKKAVGIPVFAIGGIKTGNIEGTLRAGADGIAVVSGILSAPDIRAKTEEYMRYTR